MLDLLWRAGLVVAYRLLSLYWRIFHPRTEGVCVLLWHGERLLVVRHSYKPGIGVPAGAPRRREAAEATALRELQEEVGVSLPPGALRRLGEFRSSYEGKRDHLIVFEADVEEAPQVRIDRREIVHAEWVLPRELRSTELWPPLREILAASERAGC